MDDKDGPPSAKAIDEGYNQTYLIMTNDDADADAKSGEDNHEVFFRCGNWCYKGQIQFGGISLNTEELPVLIPALQKQQGSLRYFCNSQSVPPASMYSEPLQFLADAVEFIGQQILSEDVDKELRKMAAVFPWIDDDSASTYFELTLQPPPFMKKVSMIASKSYTRGLIIISVYSEGVIYFVIQPGEGDQALLDVRFPDVSQHGQGLHIASYSHTYSKLTLWHVLGGSIKPTKKAPVIKTLNVSSSNYEQTYIILKSAWDESSPTLTVHHDVLFRFGSWCYSGRVQLTPSLSLSDIPYVIPALRMQQSRLDYLCDVNQVPTTSPFAAALAYIQDIAPLVETQIIESEGTLKELIDRLTNMGLGESVSKWLEGDSANSFFEFKVQPDEAMSEKFKNVELTVSKCYYPSGIIAITIIFQHNVYVALLENTGESPLLDSRFPDVSGKGRGYQLQAYAAPLGGEEVGWPELRKVSIWQTVGALEQEFRDKAVLLAQSKDKEDVEEGAKGSGDKGGDMEGGRERDLEGGGAGGGNVGVGGGFVGGMGYGGGEGERADSKGERGSPETEVPYSQTPQNSFALRGDKGTRGDKGYSGGPGSAAPSSPTPTPASASASTPSSNSTSASSPASNPTAPAAPKASPLTAKVALPHHLPRMDSLASKMDDIRKNIGEEGMKAPWDGKGKPLGGGMGGMGGMGTIGKGMLGSSKPLGSIPLGAIGKESKK